eukprot:gnl/MRDRNA2_/MRDRNA2_113728_c0_seq1.p1 gnl/MRDRNA2_/MRDRNA2_113728_c0~~gnl/MRDRNA2_/MRDRNA2_113728_c0_seq1.p1  ORF type:complete len:248 (-),score=55.10 gnl/MRDRNA2_/MRDRNA2_113728_c0_seq1:17-760(-)
MIPQQTLDAKTQVNQFCQRKCGRQITKADITYNTQKYGNQYQSTVSLACLGGVGFVGDLAGSQKDAEMMAAKQVVQHFAAEIAQLAAEPKTGTKRPASAMSGAGILQPGAPGEKAPKIEQPKPPKQKINEICTKLAKRILTKTDVVYGVNTVPGGFQCTLALPCLPGAYAAARFTGSVCSNKKDAETAVATIAVETLEADEELSETLKAKPPQKGKGKGWGKFRFKGWGKGKGKGGGGGAEGEKPAE